MGSRQRLENIRPIPRQRHNAQKNTRSYAARRWQLVCHCIGDPKGSAMLTFQLHLSSEEIRRKQSLRALYGGCRAKASDICLQNISRTIHYQEPRGKTSIPDTGSPLFETAENSASATYFRFQSEDKAASVNRKVVRAMSRRRKQSSADKHGRP